MRTNCGDSCNDLAQFQLVQNGSFASRVQPHHQNSHLLLAKEAFEKTLKRTHGVYTLSLPLPPLSRDQVPQIQFTSPFRTLWPTLLPVAQVRCKKGIVKMTAV